jgi:hypothetical protein
MGRYHPTISHIIYTEMLGLDAHDSRIGKKAIRMIFTVVHDEFLENLANEHVPDDILVTVLMMSGRLSPNWVAVESEASN